jgi:hypothetical protein
VEPGELAFEHLLDDVRGLAGKWDQLTHCRIYLHTGVDTVRCVHPPSHFVAVLSDVGHPRPNKIIPIDVRVVYCLLP